MNKKFRLISKDSVSVVNTKNISFGLEQLKDAVGIIIIEDSSSYFVQTYGECDMNKYPRMAFEHGAKILQSLN